MKVSIWLLTPPSLQVQLDNQIAHLAETYHGPKFISHVTLLGGLSYETEDDLNGMCHMLKHNLEGSCNGIPCRFSHNKYQNRMNQKHNDNGSEDKRTNNNSDCGIVSCYHTDATTGEKTLQWNQACVSIMEPAENLEYMNLIQKVHKLLGLSSSSSLSSPSSSETIRTSSKLENDCDNNNNNDHADSSSIKYFNPPLNKPHYSYFYGNTVPSNLLSDVTLSSPVPDFVSTQLAIWYTDPPTVDGVEKWYEKTKINLCSTTTP